MMVQGKGYKAILEATGSTWAALAERSYLGELHEWGELQRVWRAAQARRVIDKAVSVAAQDEPSERTSTSGPQGVVDTERYRTEAGLVSAALAGLLPDVHGKGAGRAAPSQINVNGNAQIFGGAPPPGTLDDFDAL